MGKEKFKNRTYSEKSKVVAGSNVYVTNTPLEWVPMEQVHELYTLRFGKSACPDKDTLSYW